MKLKCKQIENQVEDIYLVKADGADCLFAILEGGVLLRESGSELKHFIDGEFTYVSQLNNDVALWRMDGLTIIVKSYNGKLLQKDGWFYSDALEYMGSNAALFRKGGKGYIVEIDHEDYTVIKEHAIPEKYKFCEMAPPNLLIGFTGSLVECFRVYEINNLIWSIKWKEDSPEDVEYGLKKIIHDGKLYFSLKLPSKRQFPKLSSVRMLDGSLDVVAEDFPFLIKEFDKGIAGVWYPSIIHCYDYGSSRVNVVDYTDALQAAGLHEIDQRLWEIRGDELLFYQGKGSHNAMVAILDMKGKVVKCKHKFASKHGAMAQMHWAGDMVYCLMQDGTLHRIEILR